MEVHVVVRGDTLWKISRQYGIPFEELKRVNAHLANPDYIVPGMKIFLPAMHSGGKEKEPVKHSKPTHTLPQEQKPTTPTKSAPKPSVKPTPKPAPPVPPTPPTPTPTPPTPPTPPIPTPPVSPAPPMPPAHQMPMQPYMQPIFAIPCGWMPIFDADCFPFMHPGQAPHVPMEPAPMPSPMPPASAKPVLGIDDETPLKCPEPMRMPMPMPMPMPVDNALPSGWELLESPESPEILFDESTSIDVGSTTDEIPFMQQQPIPYPQTMPIGGMQQPPMQYPPSGCGCSPTINCGCGRYHPMPMSMPGQMQMPMQMPMPGQMPMQMPGAIPMHMSEPINHCNACNQPIQPMPYHMNPHPQRGQNWYGS